ncbi:MAG: 5-(carboxyamino)imidazole ribonucleotide synthase [Burkholderiaceae bacterium]|nr:MAG: 5-(carboxyamino)imidazole ribonucleotide synthase [Burkholderiaceae bacterium]
MIPPGQWLGLLGGGQLGRMFCMAAQSMGYKVAVLDPAQSCPAGDVADRHIAAAYDDAQGLQTLAELCHAVTTEFENVPAQALAYLAQHCIVNPAAEAVAVAQDRIREKQFIAQLGLQVAPHAVIDSVAALDACSAELFPGILKVSRLGYDGKGQARVSSLEQVRAAYTAMGEVPCVLEQMLPLEREISIVVARARDGLCAVYPVAQNTHRHGILDTSVVPAHIPAALAQQAREAALALVNGLNYVGVLCVEFFVLQDGRLIVNEMAPRPHNSGHYTIDACVTSQFEQQARILAGMPLGSVAQHAPAIMLNLLGDVWLHSGQYREPNWAAVLALPTAKLHLYGKTDARIGRKMGHVTLIGDDAQIQRDVVHIRQLLNIPTAE